MQEHNQSRFTGEGEYSFEGILEHLKSEQNCFRTTDFMNYLTNFGLGETAEDEMCKIQIYRRMESAFDHEFTPEQLESLFSDIGYTSPSRGNYEDVEQEVLYKMYLEHLKMTEREFTMTNEQRQNEFEKILNSLLTKN